MLETCRNALLAVTIAVATAGAAQAKPASDCPLRDRAFSMDSALMDVLLSPAATAAVQESGIDLGKLPGMFTGVTAPTFASILTVRQASQMLPAAATAVARADTTLAAVQRP